METNSISLTPNSSLETNQMVPKMENAKQKEYRFGGIRSCRLHPVELAEAFSGMVFDKTGIKSQVLLGFLPLCSGDRPFTATIQTLSGKEFSTAEKAKLTSVGIAEYSGEGCFANLVDFSFATPKQMKFSLYFDDSIEIRYMDA